MFKLVRLAVLVAVVIRSSGSTSSKTRLGQFVLDFIDPNVRRAAIVVNRDEATDAEEEFCHSATADHWIPCVSYTALDLDKAVEMLDRSDVINIVAFVGKGHGRLLDNLQSVDSEFFELRQALVPRCHGAKRLRLKLDTRVVFYDMISDGYRLEETYAIKGGKQVTRRLGGWSEKGGLKLPPKTEFWPRRSDLMASRLVSVVQNNSYFTRVNTDPPGSKHIIKVHGLFQDILHELSSSLNFTYESRLSKDLTWGKRGPNGTYDGMLGMLQSGEADVLSAGLTITSDRLDVVSYSTALAWEVKALIASAASNAAKVPKPAMYLEVFDAESWCACAAWIVVIALALMTFKALGGERFHDWEDSEDFGPANALATTSGMLLQIPYSVQPVSVASKVAHISLACSAYLLFAYYTSDLTSRMTGPPPPPVKSLKEVMANGQRVVVRVDGGTRDIMKNASKGSDLHTVYQRILKNEYGGIVQNWSQGIEVVQADPNTFYFEIDAVAVLRKDLQLRVLKIKEALTTSLALGYSKHSEFTRLFNYYLMKMREGGILQRLNKRWKEMRNDNFWAPEAERLGFEHLCGLFLVLAGGALIALGIGLIERIQMYGLNQHHYE